MTEGVRGVSKRGPKKSDCRFHINDRTHQATSLLQQHKNLVAAKSTKCQDRGTTVVQEGAANSWRSGTPANRKA